jgi:hypothetical protein
MSTETTPTDRLALSRKRLYQAMRENSASSSSAQQPLSTAIKVAQEAAKTVLQPLAQRHPLVLVAGATLLGGLLAWSRPWQWLGKPTLLVGLLPLMASKLIAQLPPESWMTVLASLVQSQNLSTPVPTTVAAKQPDKA